MLTRLTLVLVCAVLVGPYTASGADDAKRGGLSLAVEVVEPVILGHPFRLRGFATNEGDAARRISADQSDIRLVLDEDTKNTRGELINGMPENTSVQILNNLPVQWQKLTVVPPGKRVALFDCMVPTGPCPGNAGSLAFSLVGKRTSPARHGCKREISIHCKLWNRRPSRFG